MVSEKESCAVGLRRIEMSKRVIGFTAAVLLVAFAVFAGDVWKDKKYTDWDQKDVAKIMSDSPWAKAIQFGTPSSSGADAPFSGIGANNANVGQESAGGGGNSRSVSPTQPVIQGGGGGMGPVQNFIVRWYSSRTIREAMARERELQGVSADEAEKNLAAPMDHYAVLVQSNNMGLFARSGEDTLKDKSYIQLKKSKDKISPDHVVIQKAGDGNRVVAIIFEFPKTNANGQPTIAADEKGADFVTQAGTNPLKVSFDFTKMSDAKGSDM
jgi:hypothetical protein